MNAILHRHPLHRAVRRLVLAELDHSWKGSGTPSDHAAAAEELRQAKRHYGRLLSEALKGKESNNTEGGPLTPDKAFAAAMVGRHYGPEETADARAWFAAGWKARGKETAE